MLNFISVALLLVSTLMSPGLSSPGLSSPGQTPHVMASETPLVWIQAPTVPADPAEITRYVRHEQDGSLSQIIADRETCHCDPAKAANMLNNALAQAGATLHLDGGTFCGHAAQHLVATNLSKEDNEQYNLEVYLFRREPSLVTVTYLFRSDAPATDIGSQMHQVCAAL